MHADKENTAASLAVSLMRGLQQVTVCQLSKWVWDKNAGADTALEYVMEGNFVERYGKKITGKQPKIKLLIVIVF